jgi:3-oxoacyl-[acyl-carrier protein] reductase
MAKKRILVTGSGSGIGKAIAKRLAGPDTAFLLHARENRQGCERVLAELRELGAEGEYLLADLRDRDAPALLIDRIVAQWGGIDVLVANAGFPEIAPIGELTRDQFDRCYEVIQAGLFELVSRAWPSLIQSKHGRVITISTLNAHIFRPNYPTYPASAAAKAGSEAFLKAIAVQLAPYGVTANCVVPGLIEKDKDTEQFLTDKEMEPMLEHIPLKRQGKPQDVAALVGFLCSEDANYITGHIIHVNGGIV